MLSLRDHISELVTYKSKKGKSDRNLKIALSYFGFGEKGYYTEETLGKEHKITRSYLKNGKLTLKPELGASKWNLQMNNGQ